jgi:hypothetical protein
MAEERWNADADGRTNGRESCCSGRWSVRRWVADEEDIYLGRATTGEKRSADRAFVFVVLACCVRRQISLATYRDVTMIDEASPPTSPSTRPSTRFREGVINVAALLNQAYR